MPQEPDRPLLSYATPVPLAPGGVVYREGALLVVRAGATLPERCVLCGEAGAGRPLRLTFTWDASFVMQRGAKVEGKPVLQLRQKGDVHAYLCVLHGRRLRRGRLIGGLSMAAAGGMMLAGLVMGVVGESSVNPKLAPVGIMLLVAGFGVLIVALFYFTLATRTLSCVKIEEGYLRLEGAGMKFLEALHTQSRNGN